MNETNLTNTTLLIPEAGDPGYFAFFIIIIALGVPGNTLIIVIYSQRRLRGTPASWMFIFLACLDLLACVIRPSFLLCTELGAWRYIGSDTFCRLNNYCSNLVTIASILLLSLMAGDRYRRVCQPLARGLTPNKMLKANFVMVTLGSAVAAPVLFLYYNDEQGYCRLDPQLRYRHYPKVYYLLVFVLYVATSVCMILLYIRICIKVWSQARIGASLGFEPSVSLNHIPGNGGRVSGTINSWMKAPTVTPTDTQNKGKAPRVKRLTQGSEHCHPRGSTEKNLELTAFTRKLIPREPRVAGISVLHPSELSVNGSDSSFLERMETDSSNGCHVKKEAVPANSKLSSIAENTSSSENEPDNPLNPRNHVFVISRTRTTAVAAAPFNPTPAASETECSDWSADCDSARESTMRHAVEKALPRRGDVASAASTLRPGAHRSSEDRRKHVREPIPRGGEASRPNLVRPRNVRQSNDVRMTLQLVVITSIFIFTWVPIWWLMFTEASKHTRVHPSTNYYIHFYLIGHSTNAIVYAIFSKIFRQNVALLFKRCKCNGAGVGSRGPRSQ